MIKRTLERMLGVAARAIVQKYKPKIVAITGSVGKTTTKTAIAAVLSQRFRVGWSAKNFNNELGVPLTILQRDAPGRSPVAWIKLFFRAVALLVGTDPLFPQIFVIEMGADHPGDIAYLLTIAPADVGVLTSVSAAHTEFFKSLDGVLAEKKLVVTQLAPHGIAIINGDDALCASLAPEIRAHLFSFGFGETVSVRARSWQFHPDGMTAEIMVEGEVISVRLRGVIGRPVIYSALAAVQVGAALGLTLSEIHDGLTQFEAPEGRMRLLGGIKNTVLIDDTYNASPSAFLEAIDALTSLPTPHHHIVVLGDMLELGALTEDAHRRVGARVAEQHCDLLITVGAAARYSAEQARTAGMDENAIFSFGNSVDAGKFLQERMH